MLQPSSSLRTHRSFPLVVSATATDVQEQLVRVPPTSFESFARSRFASAAGGSPHYDQMNIEYNVRNIYHNLFAYFDSDNVGLSGFASKICNEDKLSEALQVVHNALQQGIRVPSKILFSLVQRCMKEKNSVAGTQLRWLIVRSGFESDNFLGSSLIRMFAMFGSLLEAKEVFIELPSPNVFAWGAIISAYSHLGIEEEAINLYHQMRKVQVEPDGYVFVAILKSCSRLEALDQGKRVHIDIIESGLESDLFVVNTLVDMYAKCGKLEDALVVFDRLPNRDVITWSALIAGYVENGQGKEALQLFEKMQLEGLKPDTVTFVLLLKACSTTGALEQGKQVHNYFMRSGFKFDLFVGSALIDMYAKCGSLEDAHMIFDRLPMRNLITWSALITGYAQQGQGQEALQLFQQMQGEGLEPDQVTFVSLLQACSCITAVEQGKEIHIHIIESGFELDLFVGNILVGMYASCGSLEAAQIVFERLPERNVVTWSALLDGYAQHGEGQAALQLFQQMQKAGLEPNHVTYLCLLKACSTVAALEHGKLIHFKMIECGFESHLFVGSALVDMYAKCGNLEDACMLFDRLPKQDVATWSALIAAYSQYSNYSMASQCFEAMQQMGLRPNGVTFLCLLSACSHVGLVNLGRIHFRQMREEHGIIPTLDHHNSMVDLLGRGCLFEEAEDLLETLPFQSNVVGWTSLLSSCRIQCNVILGRRCFNLVVTMEGGSATGYVLMSNIYLRAGMRTDAEIVEEMRRSANLWKKPAKAFIEVDNQVHDFVVGDNLHSRIGDIYKKLETLSAHMQDLGYMPRLDLILDSISDTNKEDALCGHSEKLAIAFGLISTPQGTTIRVTKNLRMCADCHNVTKMISAIELREIIVMDAYCIHRFTKGECCCKEQY